MRMGFLGPSGTYTEDAARRAAPHATHVAMMSIDAVFEAVATGHVEFGLVPIENVIAGPVTETLDNLYTYADRINIVDMLVVPIQHAIGVLPEAVNAVTATPTLVKRVLSKDQALKQCSHYLDAHFPNSVRVDTLSTAEAV